MVCLGKKQWGSTSNELFEDCSLIWSIYIPLLGITNWKSQANFVGEFFIPDIRRIP